MITINIERLVDEIENNLIFFSSSKSVKSEKKFGKLSTVLKTLQESVHECNEKAKLISELAFEYDFDEETKANGFHSFIDLFNCTIEHCLATLMELTTSRKNFFFFSRNKFIKEFTNWNLIIADLSTIFDALYDTYRNDTLNRNIFQSSSCYYTSPTTVAYQKVNKEIFYGPKLGFNFRPSMQFMLKVVVATGVSFHEFHFSQLFTIFRLLRFPLTFLRNFSSPSLRGKQSVIAYDNATTKYCQGFWNMNENKFYSAVPRILAHQLEVNEIFQINPEELLTVKRQINGCEEEDFRVPMPLSHIGFKTIQCRLLSKHYRQGMLGKAKNSKYELTQSIIFHVHGGGFAAQTSASHEIYLREMAFKLDIPIISIDYSLTPESPFPRAHEEVFYAYCWMLENCKLLGSDATHITMVGDSAGANLISSCTVKCIDLGIRIPDHLVNIYGLYNVDFVSTPSRFLSIIDPFLPYALISQLLLSYVTEPNSHQQSNTREFDIDFKNNQLISPILADDNILTRFPKTSFISTNYDPCLDDNIGFAKKLKSLNVDVTVKVVKDLPHGFLYFTQVSNDCHDALVLCMNEIEMSLK